MFLTPEEKANLEQIRDQILSPLLDKYSNSDFTAFDTCLCFLLDYKHFVLAEMNVGETILNRMKLFDELDDPMSISSESSDGDPMSISSESSESDSSDNEDNSVSKKVSVVDLQEFENEMAAILYNETIKKKIVNAFRNSLPVTGVSLKCHKNTHESFNKYIEPAMTQEEYNNNPERVKRFFAEGKGITLYDKIDRTVTTKTTEKYIATILFSNQTSLTFESLDNPKVLNAIREEFNQKVNE